MELHQRGVPGLVDQAEGVHPETFHGSERPGNTPVGHVPENVVGRFGVQRHEIPERVVRRLGLRDLPVRLRFRGVDDVRELDAILNEKHRHVVPDQIHVALLGVELHREPAGVPSCIGGPAGPQHGGKPAEHLRGHTRRQKPGPGHRLRGAVGLEDAMRCRAAGMDHPLRDPLMIEVGDLLPQMKILQQRRAPRTGLEGMVGVGQPQPLRRRQILTTLPEELTGLLLIGGNTGRGHRRRRGLIRVTGNGHNSSKEGEGNGRGEGGAGHRMTAPSAQFELVGLQMISRVSGAERSC